MASSAVKVNSGFRLAELDLDQRLADDASCPQKIEEAANRDVERRRGIAFRCR
jgi:hypothetical protein